MNIAPISSFSSTNGGYTKHRQINKIENFTINNLQNYFKESVSFASARKAEISCGVGSKMREPVCETKLEMINKMLNSYDDTLINAKETYNNLKDTDCKIISFREDFGNPNAIKKLIKFNLDTNTISEYLENIEDNSNGDGFRRVLSKRKISFSQKSGETRPVSYSENECYHQYSCLETMDRLITFKTDKNGKTVPLYYYENFRHDKYHNVYKYDYKAKYVEGSGWVAIEDKKSVKLSLE